MSRKCHLQRPESPRRGGNGTVRSYTERSYRRRAARASGPRYLGERNGLGVHKGTLEACDPRNLQSLEPRSKGAGSVRSQECGPRFSGVILNLEDVNV